MTQQTRTWVVVVVVAVMLVLRAIAGIGRETNTPLGQQRADGGATIALAVLGVVYIGHLVKDPGSGEETEVIEAVPCRRCAEDK